MTTRTTSFATRLGAAALLSAGLTGAALAADVSPQAINQVQIGATKAEVMSQLGEPTQSVSYLLAPGSAALYYVSGGTVGNEKVLEVRFDDQGHVTSTQLDDAIFKSLNRYD
ncbi:MAG: outer membrane protein assembly factor BamE [Leptothrix sp. (in: b-proteobacteria)]